MNRITADGLLYEAQTDKRILVLSENHAQASHSMRQFRDRAEHLGLVKKVRMSLGAGHLNLWRGEVEFSSLRSVLGGKYLGSRFDLVFVEEIRDRELLQRCYYDALLPMRARGVELVTA